MKNKEKEQGPLHVHLVVEYFAAPSSEVIVLSEPRWYLEDLLHTAHLYHLRTSTAVCTLPYLECREQAKRGNEERTKAEDKAEAEWLESFERMLDEEIEEVERMEGF